MSSSTPTRPSPLTAALRRLEVWRRRRGVGFPAGLKDSATRLFLMLLVTLGILIWALVWSIGYLAPSTRGTQVTLSNLLDCAKSGQVASATVYDVDHRVAGNLLASPPPVPSPAPGASPAPSPTASPAPNLCVVPPVAVAKGSPIKATASPLTASPAATASPAVHATPSPHVIASPQTVPYWTGLPGSDVETPVLVDRLSAGGAVVDFQHQTAKAIVQFLAQFFLPLVILANLFGLIFLMARTGGADAVSGVIEFGRLGKGRHRRSLNALTFADVGGAEEAVAELREVRDYLADPERFTAMGAQPPKGVLMVGPPGCGKTLMARAVAGEAGVPFFSISGAEFVESLVGVGAARVRDLFRQVRRQAPAILFIDEIDAAGRRRGGLTGGQEERESTLNQLLVEMDGFDPTSGVVVMGATNRPDILDPALLRPGRFDRQVTVEPPGLEGRKEILALHSRKRPLSADVDLEVYAKNTPGFTGADLASVVNEAALLSVRFGKDEIGREEFEEAVQRVRTGPRKRGHLMTDEERRRTAFHEAGHAVVAASTGRLDAIHRLSIVAHGGALGEIAISRDLRERSFLTRDELAAELVCALAGTAAEELVLGQPSTGVEGDLERANALAEMMVGRYGMSNRLGLVQFVRREGSEFLSGAAVPRELIDGPVLMELHQEVRRVLDTAKQSARGILERHRADLSTLADLLLEKESLEIGELRAVLEPVSSEEKKVDLQLESAAAPANGAGNHHSARPKRTVETR